MPIKQLLTRAITDKNRGLVEAFYSILVDHTRSAFYEGQKTPVGDNAWNGSACRVAIPPLQDRILQALSTTQEEDPELEAIKKAAYQEGWNDREADIIERAERILPATQEEGGKGEAIPVNLPWERVPVCACDPGHGDAPSRQQQMECRLRGGPCAPTTEPQQPSEPDPATPPEREAVERLRAFADALPTHTTAFARRKAYMPSCRTPQAADNMLSADILYLLGSRHAD